MPGEHIKDKSEQSQNLVTIYCGVSGLYWAEGGHGYVLRDYAGVFTREEAYERAGHVGPEKHCQFHDVSPTHIPTMQKKIADLKDQLAEAQKELAKTKEHLGIALNNAAGWRKRNAERREAMQALNAQLADLRKRLEPVDVK